MERASSSPPMAGPAMAAVCQASEFQAMARGSRLRGTSMGPRAVPAGDMKARPAPKIAATHSSSGTEAKSRQVATASMPALVISTA